MPVQPEEERRQLLALLQEKERILDETKLFRYGPYPKQGAFHAAGADLAVKERLLIAGNQLGKTLAAAFESAMHLTGIYPKDWQGAVFEDPTVGWAASLTSQSTRDTVQRLLLGQPYSKERRHRTRCQIASGSQFPRLL